MTRDVSSVPRVPSGPGGGEWTTGGASGRAGASGRTSSERAATAKATYKTSSKAKQDLATAAEQRVAKMLGSEPTPDNLPVDVVVKSGGKTYGVEVKSFSDNGNNKITMHPESLARKVAWGRSNHASIHTVVVDTKTRSVFYRAGVGSFRLHTLTRVENAAHLRRLIGIAP
jgi:hypothetical protein